MKLRISTGLLTLSFYLAALQPAQALTVCHDFTLFKLTGVNEDNKGRDHLVQKLEATQPLKYKKIFAFTSSDAAALAKAQRFLRPGDVVLMGTGNGHSGYMTAQGLDHFIQVPGEVGQQRDPANLPRGPIRGAKAQSQALGGLFVGDSLAQMIGRLSGQGPHPVEIWSKSSDLKVTISWDTATDVDLWIEEPNNQRCWYQRRQTANGGFLHEDVTGGKGPEHYTLARAVPGQYAIKVNYYSGPRDPKMGPTTVTIVVTRGEGTANQQTQTFTATLRNRSETAAVHTVRFE